MPELLPRSEHKIVSYVVIFLDQVPDPMSLLLLLLLLCFPFLFFLLGPLPKSLKLRRFKSDRDEIWQDYSANEYTSIDRVGFSIWPH